MIQSFKVVICVCGGGQGIGNNDVWDNGGKKECILNALSGSKYDESTQF